MKQIGNVLVTVLALAVAQPLLGSGTVTEDGVAMEVKAVVGVLDSGSPGTPTVGSDPEVSVQFTLLPYQPSAEEIAKLQGGDLSWQKNTKSPDTTKWPTWVPYAQFTLNWGSRVEIGDVKKATLNLYAYSIGKNGNNTNGGLRCANTQIVLKGNLKPGEDVNLVAKGMQKIGGHSLSWDFDVKARVLLIRKQP